MNGTIERLLNALFIGMWPPVPIELRGDLATLPPEEISKHRVRYAVRHLRWGRIVAVGMGVLAVKWAWEYGFLGFLGLGSGVALSGDVDIMRKEVAATRIEQSNFRLEYRRDRIEARIQDIDSELFQIELAISAANKQHRDPDPLHLRRQKELNTERDNLNRQLTAMSTQSTAATKATQ